MAVFLVNIDQVDVGRDVELARAELAHADDPEVDALAGFIERRAVAPVLLDPGLGECEVERDLGQRRHRAGDVGHRRALLHIEHGEALQNQMARHPHRLRK